MIVGQFNETFPPTSDGVAQVVKNYAYWLENSGDKCYVVTTKVPEAYDNYNFKVLRYNSFELFFRKGYRFGLPQLDRKLVKKINQIDFDILHAHSPFAAGKYAIKRAKKLGIPSVITFHTQFRCIVKNIVKSELMTNIIMNKIMKPYHMADEVWAVSESAIERLREYGYKGDVFVAENACDFKPSNENDDNCAEVNEEYNIPEHLPVFLFVGRMEEEKNIRMILKAVKIMKNEEYDFRILLVGCGAKLDEFKRISKSYDIEDRTIFTSGVYDRQKLRNIYTRSTALLFPSIFDVSSLVVKESAAMKLPAVLVAGSTTSSGIIDCENGYLVENEENSLAKKAEYIIDNPKDAIKAGKKAFETLYVDWEQSVKKARDRYQYLVDKNKSRSKNA